MTQEGFICRCGSFKLLFLTLNMGFMTDSMSHPREVVEEAGEGEKLVEKCFKSQEARKLEPPML